MNADDYNHTEYQQGYRDGSAARNNALLIVLNRLREKIHADEPEQVLEPRNVDYLEALDDVAAAHGLSKQTTIRYVA